MTDRNQRAREEFQLAAQRRAFAQAVATGQTGAYDRIGAKIEPGDLVVWSPPPDILLYLVKDVVPVLEPNAPPGLMRVTLTLEAPINIRAGIRGTNMLVVGRQDADGTARIDPRTAPQPDPSEPPEPPDAPAPSTTADIQESDAHGSSDRSEVTRPE